MKKELCWYYCFTLLVFIVQVFKRCCVQIETTVGVTDEESWLLCVLSSSHLWSQNGSAYSVAAAELLQPAGWNTENIGAGLF